MTLRQLFVFRLAGPALYGSLLVAAACGGRSPLATVSVGAATTSSEPDGNGGSAGSVAAGGASGRAGAGAAAGIGFGANAGAGQGQCSVDADCPAPHNVCAGVACLSSRCIGTSTPRGSGARANVPADCHAQVCDGQGGLAEVIDPSNAPAATDACSVGTCAADGTPQTKAVAAGTRCTSSSGGTVCDGVGKCVPCLVDADCAGEGSCVREQCTAAPPCPTCHCTDGTLDFDETGIDCGGACLPCANAEKCKVDQDCASDDCDPLWQICLPQTCIDQTRDGLETDLDCGGGVCAPCFVGLVCKVDADCVTSHCDATRKTCIGNPCADARQDGDESDIDCGGLSCGGCQSGQKCRNGFDCYTGCNAAMTPHVCN